VTCSIQCQVKEWDLWADSQGSPPAEGLQRLMTLIYSEQLLHL